MTTKLFEIKSNELLKTLRACKPYQGNEDYGSRTITGVNFNVQDRIIKVTSLTGCVLYRQILEHVACPIENIDLTIDKESTEIIKKICVSDKGTAKFLLDNDNNKLIVNTNNGEAICKLYEKPLNEKQIDSLLNIEEKATEIQITGEQAEAVVKTLKKWKKEAKAIDKYTAYYMLISTKYSSREGVWVISTKVTDRYKKDYYKTMLVEAQGNENQSMKFMNIDYLIKVLMSFKKSAYVDLYSIDNYSQTVAKSWQKTALLLPIKLDKSETTIKIEKSMDIAINKASENRELFKTGLSEISLSPEELKAIKEAKEEEIMEATQEKEIVTAFKEIQATATEEKEQEEEATTEEKRTEFSSEEIKVKEKTQQELYEELEPSQQGIYKKLKELDGITTEIVGKWLWCDGNTKENKDKLKALGLKFSGPRQKWYLRDSNTTKYRRPSKKTYMQIKSEYNSIIANDDDK